MGIHVVAEIADTDERLPPFATPGINMRGIPAARYQGSHVATVEGEITWQANYRWSLLGFAGAGRAANSTADFSDESSQVSKGVGFRYLVAKQYGFNMDSIWDWMWQEGLKTPSGTFRQVQLGRKGLAQ